MARKEDDEPKPGQASKLWYHEASSVLDLMYTLQPFLDISTLAEHRSVGLANLTPCSKGTAHFHGYLSLPGILAAAWIWPV